MLAGAGGRKGTPSPSALLQPKGESIIGLFRQTFLCFKHVMLKMIGHGSPRQTMIGQAAIFEELPFLENRGGKTCKVVVLGWHTKTKLFYRTEGSSGVSTPK